MEIEAFNRADIRLIKDLWQDLNAHHRERSTYFKDHFTHFTFRRRVADLLDKEELIVLLATMEGDRVGYCVATLEKGIGEVDSIYVLPEKRGQGIGEKLMADAIQWLEHLNCDPIRVSIAEGNEAVMDFYRKFGFAQRFTVLQMRRSQPVRERGAG